MYKTKLQELCHQKRWGLPRYSSMKDGPDHIPSFKSSVSVNGLTFDSLGPCSSSKLAQNEAAMLAFLHFTSSDPPSPLRTTDLNQHNKSQLQNSVQRKSFDSSAFMIESEGLPPVPRLKGTGLIDGQHFESSTIFSTSKEAEQAAAKLALMRLSLDSFQKDDSGRYKNLLQELARKEGFCNPTYKNIKSGAVHMPTFFSIVELEGKEFHGKAVISKKPAEQDATKVAYMTLKEYDAQEQNLDEMLLPSSIELRNEISYPSFLQPYEEDMMRSIRSLPPSEAVFESSTKHCQASLEMSELNLSSLSISKFNKAKTTETGSYLINDRIRVYTSFPEISVPEGITILPIRENKWVAVCLEFPNERKN